MHFCGIGIMDTDACKVPNNNTKNEKVRINFFMVYFYLLDNSDYIKDFYCG